jgi:hypothetical protein
MRDLSNLPGSTLYLPWVCPRCETSGNIAASPFAPFPMPARLPCCGMAITIYPPEEVRRKMAAKLNAAISLLDPDTRYCIRYGTTPEGEHEAVGYVDRDRSGMLHVYANNNAYKGYPVARDLVRSICLARKPHTQLYPKPAAEEGATDGANAR